MSSNSSTIARRIREVIDARALTIDGFARLVGTNSDRVKAVLGEKQRAPADMLQAMARLPDVDIQYVLTGVPFDAPGVRETAAAYDTGLGFVANLFVAHKLHRDGALMNAIASVDACAEHSPRVRGALSNVATALQGWEPKRLQTRSAKK